MEASTRQGMIGRLLRLGVSNAAGSSSDDPTAVGELETELALLREENAWLKVERHRPPDAGRIVERMRELGQASGPPVADSQAPQAAETAQAMHECLAIRDGLLDACKEIQQAMQGIRTRLSGLSVEVQGHTGEAAPHPQSATPSNGEVDLERAVRARATSDLSRNLA
jgi:hypothetical protein